MNIRESVMQDMALSGELRGCDDCEELEAENKALRKQVKWLEIEVMELQEALNEN